MTKPLTDAEALERAKWLIGCEPFDPKIDDTLPLARFLIARLTPVKPTLDETGRRGRSRCACGHIPNVGENFCGNCGHPIDWGTR